MDDDTNGNTTGEPFGAAGLSLPLHEPEFNVTAVTESSTGENLGERTEPAAHQPGEQHLVHLESVQQLRAEQRPMEQQLEFPAGNASEPDQRLEPDHAAGDALLQHRPARDGPRQIRAGHRAGRSGSGGVAVACALGQLGSRSRTYRHLPDCDLGVHWPGQVADRTQLSWRATSRRSSSLACFPSNGGPSAASTAGPTRTK